MIPTLEAPDYRVDYRSRVVHEAMDIQTIIDAINAGGTCEGIEGIEFSPEMLAGDYAAKAAEANGDVEDRYTDEALEGHLDVLAEKGAVFDSARALAHAFLIAWHVQAQEVKEEVIYLEADNVNGVTQFSDPEPGTEFLAPGDFYERLESLADGEVIRTAVIPDSSAIYQKIQEEYGIH